MSVLIKGMEMPNTCEECNLESFCDRWIEARKMCGEWKLGVKATIRHPDCPLVTVHPRWISVKERLPKEKVKVIIAVADMYYNMGDNTGVVIGWRYGDWYTYTAKGCEKINYPIAWMSRPEPPKEET